jgi:NAD(P)-dependent dehydrogenase (short-subunit alcohol dehydrogenase family)
VEINKRFAGKIVLVAGGTGGLGRAISLAFLEEGGDVAVTYRDEKEFGALKSAAGSTRSLLKGYPVDVTDEGETKQLISTIFAEHSRLDVMVDTVGGYAGGTRLWESETKEFDQMLALNLRSGLVLLRAVIPGMLRQKGGAIVYVASKAAVDHAGRLAAYAASKAAAVAMIDSLAEDLRGTGVRVNTILPSVIDTETNRKAMPKEDFSRWPKPGEIARVILFLCSDDAKVIHGAAVPVYGAG